MHVMQHLIKNSSRIVNENDLPLDIVNVLDDITINGTVFVIRPNRPNIKISVEPEIDAQLEKELVVQGQQVLNDPHAIWFNSVDELVADLETQE